MDAQKMMKIYIVGNLLVKEDSVPLMLLEILEKTFPDIEFEEFEPTENFPDTRNPIILDTVLGISRVEIITDIDKIITNKVYSLHDFDVGFNLKLLKKTGKIDNVTIIGIPAHVSIDKIKKQLIAQISALTTAKATNH